MVTPRVVSSGTWTRRGCVALRPRPMMSDHSLQDRARTGAPMASRGCDNTPQARLAGPARRQAGSGARICTPVDPELDPFGVLGGRAGTFRDRGTEPATGTGPRPAGLGCSGAGREQCGMPAASVPPHPSQPLHLACHPVSPAALLRQPSGAAETGQGGPTADPQPTRSSPLTAPVHLIISG